MFEDEPVAAEPVSSYEKAQEYVKENPIFGPEPETKPPATETAPPKDETKPPVEETKPPVEQTPEEKAAAEAKAKEAAPTADEKAIVESPKYKELEQASQAQKAILDELKPILTEGRYTIDSPTALKGVIEDSFIMYDIAAGKEKVGALLNLFEKNWKPEQFQAVMLDLADYLAAKDVKVPELDPRKPQDRAVIELRNKDVERTRQDSERQVQETRQKATTTLQTTINGLAEKAGVSKEDIFDYALVISAKVGADPKILQLLEQGKAGAELERLFTEHHNRELARQQRWTQSKIAAKSGREKDLPKVPAREQGAAPSGGEAKPFKKREELQTSEGRLAAAKRYMDSTKS